MATAAHIEVRVWSFHCAECGFGHQELGHLATDDEVYCLVCTEAEGRFIRLQRWTDVEPPPRRARVAEKRIAA